MKPIEWTEQDKYFGLDYSTKKGKWWNYTFDIRYDYDGNPEVKPNCGLVLTIYYKDKVIGKLPLIPMFNVDFLIKDYKYNRDLIIELQVENNEDENSKEKLTTHNNYVIPIFQHSSIQELKDK